MMHIKVPATSANMGPGFDSIGVALELYNHLWFEEIEQGVEIIVKKEHEIKIPTDKNNLIYKTMVDFFSETPQFVRNQFIQEKSDLFGF